MKISVSIVVRAFSLSLSLRIHYFQQNYKDKQLQRLSTQCIRADIMRCGQSTPMSDVSIADWNIDAQYDSDDKR